MQSHAITPTWETIDGAATPAGSRAHSTRSRFMPLVIATAVTGSLLSGVLALARGESLPLSLLQVGITMLIALLVLIPSARVLGTLSRAGRDG